MNKEQEEKVIKKVKEEMTRVRNNSIVAGMKSALSVVLDMCNKDISDDHKLKEIRVFCEKGLHNGEVK